MGVVDGAAKGAAMGSVVPGIGTVAGGVVGGIAGIFGGDDEEEAQAANEELLGPAPLDGQQYGDQYWGGQGYKYDQGKAIPGTSGADLDVNRFRSIGEAAANRAGPQLDYRNANAYLDQGSGAMLGAYADRSRGLAMRGQQQQSANLMRDAAMGNAPSRAEIMGRSMIGQSLRAQMAGAAGARGGPMAQMAAQRQVQQGAAQFQQQGMGQLAAMRADEMARARDAWMQGLSGIRGQDYGAAQQAAGMAGVYNTMGQTSAQMAQQQGQMELGQRQLNDARSLGMERLGYDTRSTAFTGNQADARLRMEQQKLRDDASAKEREQNMEMISAGIGAAATVAGAAAKAEGGPVEGGQPYIVGERGPELVVPAKDGVVVPNHKMGEVLALYEPPGKQLHQSLDGRAFYADQPTQDDGRPRLASSESTSEKRSSIAQAAAQKAKAPAASRPLTPDELRAAADKLEREMVGTHQARMAAGPAVRPSLGEVAASEIGKLRMAHAQGAITDEEFTMLVQNAGGG